MENVWNHVVRNSLWAAAFGIFLIILSVFVYKKRLKKQLPALMVMLLCLTQCLGKGLAAALYRECSQVSADAYKLIQTIAFLGSITEIATAIIISVILIWYIKCLFQKSH